MNQWGKDWIWMRGHATWLKDAKDHLFLKMEREDFNDSEQFNNWKIQGHSPRTGLMFDMRHDNQPALNQQLIDYVKNQGLENIGVSYYRMDPGDNLPYHSDLYKKYISLFNLENRKQNIVRFIFFPENRQPGHIFEVDGKIVDWRAGDWVAWRYDTTHLAANMGYAPRYSIQVTGVLRENI